MLSYKNDLRNHLQVKTDQRIDKDVILSRITMTTAVNNYQIIYSIIFFFFNHGFTDQQL